MFGRYGIKSLCTDENDSENWSFPSNYERFSTVNVPKSRLGRRRRNDTSSEIKRDVLQGLPTESSNNLSDNGIGGPQDGFLTHPVNSALTPSHNVGSIKTYNLHGRSNQEDKVDCNVNVGSLTPFRKEGFQPLHEINNIINLKKITPDPGKPLPSKGSSGLKISKDSPENHKALEKSFESRDSGANAIVPYSGVLSASTEQQEDSSQSDMCNNSSFMTAHDIYNVDKARPQYESVHLKTPRKGFCLLDMLASPVDPVSNILNTDNESYKNMLSKTPGFNNLETFKTPFRAQGRLDRFTNEMFTPTLKNNPKTPMIRASSSTEETDVNTKVSSSIMNCEGNPHIKQSLAESNTFFKTTPPTDDNKTFCQNDNSEHPKQSPSLEFKVKRRIFEGLGWALPPSSFSPGLKSEPYQNDKRIKELNSVLLTPTSNSIIHSPKNMNECNINSSEMDMDYHSINIGSESHCNETSDHSVLAKDDSHYTNITNQTSVYYNESSSLTNGNPVEQLTTEIPLTATIKDPEIDVEKEVYSDTMKNCSNSPKSLDTGFSSSSLMHAPESDQCSLHIQSSSAISKTAELDCEETNMDTVPSENEALKDVTVIAQHPGKGSTPKQSVNPSIEPPVSTNDNKNIVPLQSHEEPKCDEIREPFVAPCQPPVAALNYPRQQSNIVFVNKKPYTVLSMLGRGGSSEVYQVLDTQTSKLMAMKFVNLASVEDSIATGYLNEIEVLTKLQGCPSVIRMFDSEYIPQSKILYVVMEKGDTDFSRLMKDIMKTKKISMSMITYYWTEMLSCVKDIHEKGIIHSDLKPANFLLVSGRLKLIDFGIASSLQGDMTSVLKDVTTGTFNYMSPEAIRNCGENRGYKITYKSDIWSLGCILYNLLYGRTPFSHLTNTWAKLGAIADPETSVLFPSDTCAPPHLLFSVRWALSKDPKERPTAAELLKLAELTPGAESKLGRQISSLLAEYISQNFLNLHTERLAKLIRSFYCLEHVDLSLNLTFTFPNCSVKV